MGKAILCVNGDLPPVSWLESIWQEYSLHLAADGAINQLDTTKLAIDYIIGDLDSISFTEQNRHITTKKIAEQDTTDGEKAILYLIENAYTTIDLVGYKGKRSDHFLYHLHLLGKEYQKQVRIRLIDENETILCLQGTGYIQAPLQTTISFYPLFDTIKNASIQGLAYPIDNLNLSMLQCCSQSNVTTKKEVRFNLHNQKCICILQENYKHIDLVYE